MYLLDTNHLSRLLARDSVVRARLGAIGDAEVTTCVIVQGELVFMAERSEQRDANTRQVEGLLAALRIYAIDEETAEWYGVLKAAVLRHFGPKSATERVAITIAQIGVSENDLWIAAVVKRHDLTLVSSDSDFERIGEVTALKRESWVAPPA